MLELTSDKGSSFIYQLPPNERLHLIEACKLAAAYYRRQNDKARAEEYKRAAEKFADAPPTSHEKLIATLLNYHAVLTELLNCSKCGGTGIDSTFGDCECRKEAQKMVKEVRQEG
jgi:hypothetical protein